MNSSHLNSCCFKSIIEFTAQHQLIAPISVPHPFNSTGNLPLFRFLQVSSKNTSVLQISMHIFKEILFRRARLATAMPGEKTRDTSPVTWKIVVLQKGGRGNCKESQNQSERFQAHLFTTHSMLPIWFETNAPLPPSLVEDKFTWTSPLQAASYNYVLTPIKRQSHNNVQYKNIHFFWRWNHISLLNHTSQKVFIINMNSTLQGYTVSDGKLFEHASTY